MKHDELVPVIYDELVFVYIFAIDYQTINEENRPQLSVRADKMQKLEDATEAEASYSC
jgi:hypothetical protein